jgi:hypothetical protein
MTTPTTEAIQGAVLIGFQTMAARFSVALGLPIGSGASVDSILEDFQRWFDGERALAFNEALAAVQEAINENVPITSETILRIENPYA